MKDFLFILLSFFFLFVFLYVKTFDSGHVIFMSFLCACADGHRPEVPAARRQLRRAARGRQRLRAGGWRVGEYLIVHAGLRADVAEIWDL